MTGPTTGAAAASTKLRDRGIVRDLIEAAHPSFESIPIENKNLPGGDNREEEATVSIPIWTKGPPATPEEVAEYKAFMKAKYEAEQKENARLLRLKQAGLG